MVDKPELGLDAEKILFPNRSAVARKIRFSEYPLEMGDVFH